MQDRIIAEIGHWQLEKNSDLQPSDLYIEDMFPGKDYCMLLLIFEIADGNCNYKGIEAETVGKGSASFRKYAYRKGSARGGDVTLTTKLSYPIDKKWDNIKTAQLKKLSSSPHQESTIFKQIEIAFIENEGDIKNQVEEYFNNASRDEKMTTGISLRIDYKGIKYLNDFELVREIILDSGQEKKYEHNGTVSRQKNAVCSVTGEVATDIYGFAAPFKYSTPDKPGVISGFFNKEKFWRNYPVSSTEALALEYGKKFVMQNLSGYFYGNEYMFVPHPVISGDREQLEIIIEMIQDAFDKSLSPEERGDSEDYVQKIIGEQENYFYLDILFYTENKTNKSISINMMLEEVLPSRFKQLFLTAPESVNEIPLFKNAIVTKKEIKDLKFSYEIIKQFSDDKFLDVVQQLFMGTSISKEFLFEKIMSLIRKNYNTTKSGKWAEYTSTSVLKAIMLINYLLELEIIQNNKNYTIMDTSKEENQKSGSFNLEGFKQFVTENGSFLDSDIKVGVFALGVAVRFLFDSQYANLKSTPFESKLHGYNLNPDLLMQVYREALNKIQQYHKFYAYIPLREILNNYFVVKSVDMKALSNNELSFYFVAGLEMGKRFKNEKSSDETSTLEN